MRKLIKSEDFIPGTIYVYKCGGKGDYEIIGLVERKGRFSDYINRIGSKSPSYDTDSSFGYDLYEATEEEKQWLLACIAAGKIVLKDLKPIYEIY